MLSRQDNNFQDKKTITTFGQLILPLTIIIALALMFFSVKLFFYTPMNPDRDNVMEEESKQIEEIIKAKQEKKTAADKGSIAVIEKEDNSTLGQKRAGKKDKSEGEYISINPAKPIKTAVAAKTKVEKRVNEEAMVKPKDTKTHSAIKKETKTVTQERTKGTKTQEKSAKQNVANSTKSVAKSGSKEGNETTKKETKAISRQKTVPEKKQSENKKEEKIKGTATQEKTAKQNAANSTKNETKAVSKEAKETTKKETKADSQQKTESAKKQTEKKEGKTEQAQQSSEIKTEQQTQANATDKVKRWDVQIGGFSDKKNAEQLMQKAKNEGYKVYINEGTANNAPYYRIRVQGSNDKEKTGNLSKELSNKGYPVYLVAIE